MENDGKFSLSSVGVFETARKLVSHTVAAAEVLFVGSGLSLSLAE